MAAFVFSWFRVQLMMGNVLRARSPCMQDLSATAGLELNEMLKSLADV